MFSPKKLQAILLVYIGEKPRYLSFVASLLLGHDAENRIKQKSQLIGANQVADSPNCILELSQNALELIFVAKSKQRLLWQNSQTHRQKTYTCVIEHTRTTVDGRNPAPPGMYKIL